MQGRREHYKSEGAWIEGHLGGVSSSQMTAFCLGVKHIMKRENSLHDENGPVPKCKLTRGVQEHAPQGKF